MSTDPTEAMVRREIAAAREIIRQDKILAKLGKAFPDEPEADPNAPPAPPKKDPADAPPPKRGVWWGEAKGA